MSNQTSTVTSTAKKKLPIAGQALDIDAELKKFEEEERKRLGLDGKVDQWVEDMVGLGFKKSERAKVTLLIGGLTDVCVHYTFADAHQRDFYVRVVTDCVGGSSQYRHDAALDAMEYLQTGALRTSEEILGAFRELSAFSAPILEGVTP